MNTPELTIDEACPSLDPMGELHTITKVRIINTSGKANDKIGVTKILKQLDHLQVEELIVEESSRLTGLDMLPPIRTLRIRNTGTLDLAKLQNPSMIETLTISKKNVVANAGGVNFSSLDCLVMPFTRDEAVTIFQNAPKLKK